MIAKGRCSSDAGRADAQDAEQPGELDASVLGNPICEGDGPVPVLECQVLIFHFAEGHIGRTVSRTLRAALDVARPVIFIGPPSLPASASYREPVGTSRAGYGVWVPAHKTVQLRTTWRAGRGASGRSRWDQTVSTSALRYGQHCVSSTASTIDSSITAGFWKAVLRHIRMSELGVRSPDVGSAEGCSLLVRFGSGKELRCEVLGKELLLWLRQVEAHTDQFG